MTSIQREIVLAMMDTNCNMAEAGRIVNKTRNAVCYHIEQVQRETGLDMRVLRDLLKLHDMVKVEDDMIMSFRFCAKCGVELDKANIAHTRILTCDDYRSGNVQCVDMNLCVSCKSKLIAYANGKEV